MRKKRKDTAILTKQRKAIYWEGVLWTVALYVVLILGVLICVFPFYLMASSSFKENHEIVTSKQRLLPEQFDLRKYALLFHEFPYGRNLFNSFFASIINTVLVTFFCSLAGFAFAKYPFPGRNTLFLLLLVTMMVPFQVLMVPTYVIIRRLGWLNTYYALTIPGAASAFGIFLMRQYIAGAIPDELLDAAEIDGCTKAQIYFRIVLPCLVPGLTVLGLLTFMANWNNFLWPFVVISRKEMYTITLVIQALALPDPVSVKWGAVFAASSLAVVPLIVIFLFFQKKIISSVMSGFMKF